MTAVFRRLLVLGVSSVLLSATLTASANAATKPTKPTTLKARTGQSTAVLTWNPAKHATHYRTCLLTSKTQKKCGAVSGKLTEPTHRVTRLKPRSGTDYYFRVYAYNGSGRTGSGLKGFNLNPLITPAIPTGIKQTVTSSAVTITWKPAKNAVDYSICLAGGTTSTRCIRTSPRSPALTARFTDLTPTNGGDYFYRIEAHNRTRSSHSKQQRIDLPVGSTTDAIATNGGVGSFEATWSAATNADSYELQIATNSAMTSRLKSYTVTDTSASPVLPIGETYYFRVRGLNKPQYGRYTPVATLRLPSETATAKVMTYNLCGQDKCVTTANGMKKWSTRKKYAGELVRGTDADIIATQESHDKDTQFGRELPGFGLAAYKSAKSLFYNKSKYDVRRSGTMTLSSAHKKYAVWAELIDFSTRNRFLVVDAHLQPKKGKANDDLRAAQTRVLIRKVAEINPENLPVIYAGDYNSNKDNANQAKYKSGYDAPTKIFLEAGILDTYTAADRRVHADFNSANQAKNPPLRHSDHVDHIYADPEIDVVSWRVWTRLDGKNYATPFATDHNPVRAILTIPGR